MRATAAGKFLQLGPERFWVKGVSYGTFAPDADGHHFPPPARIAEDFALMRRVGVNTVRTYTVPDQRFLDLAQQHGLRIMVGVPWADHVAFLDDRRLSRAIRRDVMARVRAVASHPAVVMLALGNEIPAAIVRWLGPERVERFLAVLYADAKAIAPGTLFTYVNYPPTEFTQPAVRRPGRVQCLSPSRTRSPRTSATAESRRSQAAARGRGRGRQRAGRRE